MRIWLARTLMNLWPLTPDFDTLYTAMLSQPLEATPSVTWTRLAEHAEFTYRDEVRMPWLMLYYRGGLGNALPPGARVLDIGCSVGGRSIRMAEALKISLVGLDVVPQDLVTATRMARQRGARASYTAGVAEALPFGDASFDAITSYDAFEHLRSLAETLDECWRVLKPGGHLLTVFPPIGAPLESHLMVSGLPCLHWVFSGTTLTAAQHAVARARGWPAATVPATLEPWERLPTLNGVTERSFAMLLQRRPWEVAAQPHAPLFSTGRRAQESWVFRALHGPADVVRRLVPILRPWTTDRCVYLLRKPA
jgi:2-polyprenyl-3-methyl-5-hydroxy-6-metoxy-1,4-benzoquinol methylase